LACTQFVSKHAHLKASIHENAGDLQSPTLSVQLIDYKTDIKCDGRYVSDLFQNAGPLIPYPIRIKSLFL
jgi:hypothetical protein